MTSEIDGDDANLSRLLDRVIEVARKPTSSFRSLAEAAGLDPTADFVGTDLSGLDFRDEDLRGFNFSKADLKGADFRRADVRGVSFTKADLTGAIGLPLVPGATEEPTPEYDPILDANLALVLPEVPPDSFTTLVEALDARPTGEETLAKLADDLILEVDELFPIADVLQLIRFADLAGNRMRLTPAGQRYARTDMDARKRLFAQHLLAYIPLAGKIRLILEWRPNHKANARRFRGELADHMTDEYAEQTLSAVTAWGRHAGAFIYDAAKDLFYIKEPELPWIYPSAPTTQSLFPTTNLDLILNEISIASFSRLADTLNSWPDGEDSFANLEAELGLSVEELLPITDLLQLFRFAEFVGDRLRLTPSGRHYADADLEARRPLFAEHLLANVPLADHIRRVLDARPQHKAPAYRFRDELEDYMEPEHAEQTLKAVIAWGRYGRVFAYDEVSDVLIL